MVDSGEMISTTRRTSWTGTGDPGSYAKAELAVGAMVQQIGWAPVLDEARRRSGTSGQIDDRQILAWYRDSLAGLG